MKKHSQNIQTFKAINSKRFPPRAWASPFFLTLALLLTASSAYAQQSNADTLFITEDGKIEIGGPTKINEGLTVTGYFYVGESAEIAKNLDVKGNVTVNGNLTSTGSATMKNNLTVNGNLVSAGPATMKKSLIVEGGLTTQAPVTMKKSLTVKGTLTAPRMITGSVHTVVTKMPSPFGANIPDIYVKCKGIGTGKCSDEKKPACSAGNNLKEVFMVVQDKIQMNYLYHCISK